MAEPLPSPLTPADADLTDFKFMPLQIARLRKSKAWLVCKRRPELAFFMLNLWTAAWHERPAGSLEDDDDVLADLAMCSPEKWEKVRAEVLRGWVKCTDGRLYHRIVAELVVDAWKSKRIHAYDRECGRLRKALKRAGIKEVADGILPTFEQWSAAEMSGGRFDVSGGQIAMSSGHTYISASCPADTGVPSTGSPAENALKGKGKGESKGQGQGQGYIYTRDADVRRTNAHPPENDRDSVPPQIDLTETEHHERFERVWALYPKPAGAVSKILVEKACRDRVDEGATWDELEASAGRMAKFVAAGGRSGPEFINSPLKYFSDDALWRAEWTPPQTKADQRLQGNVNAAAEAKRQLLRESQ